MRKKKPFAERGEHREKRVKPCPRCNGEGFNIWKGKCEPCKGTGKERA